MTTTFAFDVSLDKSNSQLSTEIRAYSGSVGSLQTYLPIPTGNFAWLDAAEESGYVQAVLQKSNLTLRNMNAYSSNLCAGALVIQRVNYRRWYKVTKFIYLEGSQGDCTITFQVEQPGVIRQI